MEKNYLFKRAALAQILTFSNPEKLPSAVFLSTYFLTGYTFILKNAAFLSFLQ